MLPASAAIRRILPGDCIARYTLKYAYSTTAANNSRRTGNDDVIYYTKLTNRSLIRLKGAGVDTFLQGLVTNDVKAHFKSRPPNDSHYYSVMYSFMLNTQGRVLYDLLMYAHLHNGEDVLIECDRDILSDFKKLLQTYRLRKKIDIDDSIDQNHQTFCAYYDDVTRMDVKSIKERLSGAKAAPPGGGGDNAILCPDPRIPQLGCRVILPSTADTTISSRFFNDIPEKPMAYYRRRRYALGVGEGCLDLPVGNCFPLESNGDYLNGVSFHKGCYVGQELTARTHHTGVVRKRLMPLFFEQASIKNNMELIKPDAKIFLAESQENVGKFRNGQDDVGLALLRVDEALKAPNKLLQVSTSDGQKFAGTTEKPDWWLNNTSITGEVHVNAQPAKA